MTTKLFSITIFVLLALFFVSCDTKPPIDDPVIEDIVQGDFENWITISQGEISFHKPAGDWWDGLNYLAVIGGPITLERTTDSYNGNYALRIETKLWGDELSIPGIIASGYFDPNLPIGENLVIGKPFSKRPTAFQGYYKYSAANNDTLVIFIALTKYNSAQNLRDTIGRGEFVSSEVQNTYKNFNVPIVYNSENTPDSIHIILLASVSGKDFKGHPGSVLIVDKLSLRYD
ncbi:MAG TPA: PCMD domain-containing protein [Bacteroidales bacterium]|nr:PCMD domain-containing protein [Bacteroidales bacterium]HOL98192.1 PCMD domain-containing protein [Bacteroidales bacterium]HOM36415.1 PCMD domain-containing protein [Bacteroidales bacterium]HPD23911.1 PCMD domain-containing protein [Bacteroidales bacterium]HRS99982.1 PCMD domain-containing protein [Bacteroidales bacterium]